MAKKIIVNVIPEETRMALLDDQILVEAAVERTDGAQLVGNIYKARIENVLPGMQAAFVNIGTGRNAFLYAGDIFPHKPFQKLVSEDILAVGRDLMVEIAKDALGTKGPRATTHFSVPGRYVVLMPTVDYVGISRRIESVTERSRLREIAQSIRPAGMGVIVRTVAEGRSEEELTKDFRYLENMWNALLARYKRVKAPSLLYRDADLLVRIVRDHLADDIKDVIIDDAEAFERTVEMLRATSPDLVKKIHLFKGKTDIFSHYGVEAQWSKITDRRVDLKCGGYLVIDKTEALTVIDVNTGKFVGNTNLADTVFRTNLEAAAEIARQLRLRDIGGIIVIDFIDMSKDAQKQSVLSELESCLKADKTKSNVLGITELGLVEMTRKKARQTFAGTIFEECVCCDGRGLLQSPETIGISIKRQLRKIAAKRPGADLVIQIHPRVATYFDDPKALEKLARELLVELTVETTEAMHGEAYAIFAGEKALARSTPVERPKRRRAEGMEAECEVEIRALPSEIRVETIDLEAVADFLWEPFIDDEPPESAEHYELSEVETMPRKAEVSDLDEIVVLEDAVQKGSNGRRKRRRRKPAAKQTEATVPVETLDSETIITPIIAESGSGEEDTPVKKAKRRRRRKKPASPVSSTEISVQEETAPASELSEEVIETLADNGETPAKKKSRRRPRRKKKIPETQADVAVEAATVPVEMIAQEVLKAKPRRRRRRRKPASSESIDKPPTS